MYRIYRILNIQQVLTKKELLPLENLIDQYNLSLDTQSLKPSRLISQISGLSKELIEQLEMAGIYDTHDFIDSGAKLRDYLGFDDNQYSNLKDIICGQEQIKLILNLPKNYAFIAIDSDHQNNVIAFLWNGLLLVWSNSIDDGWILSKHLFDKIFNSTGRPELIGSLDTLNESLTWLSEIVDISIYIKIPAQDMSLQKIAEKLGYPDKVNITKAEEIAEQKVLQLAFITEIAKKST